MQNSDTPKVSLLVPICNVERYLRECLDSAVAQTLDFMGVPNHPDPHSPGTRVFEFPVRTHARQKASDKPATEQLERYFAVMDADPETDDVPVPVVAPRNVTVTD